ERGTKVGFEVCRSSVGDEVTTILYDDAEKRVIIDCSKSSTAMCAVFADNDVKPISEPIWGYFYLLRAFSFLLSKTCTQYLSPTRIPFACSSLLFLRETRTACALPFRNPNGSISHKAPVILQSFQFFV
ncbi:hypothetical protein PR002_g20930, partial [Phytophthora rubi]